MYDRNRDFFLLEKKSTPLASRRIIEKMETEDTGQKSEII
jgi:hypothetical protein